MQAHLFDETDTNGFYYVIWRRDGTELAHSTNAPALIRKVEPAPVKSDRVADDPENNVTGPPELRGPPGPSDLPK